MSQQQATRRFRGDRGAIGTGAATLQNIPSVNFVQDPGAFFAQTSKNVSTPKTRANPDPGGFFTEAIPAAGVVSKLLLTFTGTLTVAAAPATTSNRWPYGLLDNFQLSANGQNDLYNVDGLDLHALRFARYPAYEDAVDTFASAVGGGDAVAVGSTELHLTWEIPIAMDDTSLIGALYAQSAATNLQLRVQTATMAQLFSTLPANASITGGQWSVQTTFFDIPVDAEGRIIVPDLSALHGVQAVSSPFTAVGENRIEMIRSAGQLSRLFIAAESSSINRLSALPSAAATKELTELRLEYGSNRRPYVYTPAATLLATNNMHYGAPLPYDRLCLDFVKENPMRDRVLLQGVTELAVVPTIGASVVVTAGKVRVVQETLF